MIDHYQAVGITPSVLAETGKKLLNATTVKHLRLRGWIDKRRRLPEGYKIISGYRVLCNACMKCVDVCPRGAIEVNLP